MEKVKSLYYNSQNLYIPAQFRLNKQYNKPYIKIQFKLEDINEISDKCFFRTSNNYYVIERLIPSELFELLLPLKYELQSYYTGETNNTYHYCQFRLKNDVIHVQIPITNDDLTNFNADSYQTLTCSNFYRKSNQNEYIAFDLPLSKVGYEI